MTDAFNQAVSALLQHSDPHSRQQANSWLEQWQQTPEAWTVAADVLQNSQSIDAQYFAAQTLRTKVTDADFSGNMMHPQSSRCLDPVHYPGLWQLKLASEQHQLSIP